MFAHDSAVMDCAEGCSSEMTLTLRQTQKREKRGETRRSVKGKGNKGSVAFGKSELLHKSFLLTLPVESESWCSSA